MIFTVLIWTLLLLVYISGRNNKTNLWCVISGLFFSIGTFKEFFFFDLRKILAMHPALLPPDTFFIAVYSIMTALLYYLTMPFAVIFALHFNGFPTRYPTAYRKIAPALFVPACVLTVLFNPMQINHYQHGNHAFWYAFTAYNLVYGILMAALMISAEWSEPSRTPRRQKRLVNLIILPPVWFWLISIFVFHSLNLGPLLKVWKGNQYLLFIVVVFYIAAAFREGMMGIRLRQEHYQWDSDLKIATRGTQYTSHILKNELTKIEWSVNNLRSRLGSETPEELAIIERSTQHLKRFVEKTQLYSNDILLQKKPCQVYGLIENAIGAMREYAGFEITFTIECQAGELLLCDEQHTCEVLKNLIANAIDAMDGSGNITIIYSRLERRRYDVLSVRDQGKGVSKQQLSHIFEPYFTTKKTNTHFGLGLAYCANAIKKHGGYIDVASEEGYGSVFSLCFPKKD